MGYSTIALNYVLESKFDPKNHSSNRPDELLKKLKPRDGIIILKRLTIVLDGTSEKGFGLVSLSPVSLTQSSSIPRLNKTNLISRDMTS